MTNNPFLTKGKRLLTLLFVISLTGCASVDRFYAAQDICQTKWKPADYKPPAWGCGGSNRTYLYDLGGNQVGYIKR